MTETLMGHNRTDLWADNRLSQGWDMIGIQMGHNGMGCDRDMDGVLQG